MPVWIVSCVKGPHDPDLDVLGAWSTHALAKREAERLTQEQRTEQQASHGHTFEVSELTLDEPFKLT
jgi:hypothetical protein